MGAPAPSTTELLFAATEIRAAFVIVNRSMSVRRSVPLTGSLAIRVGWGGPLVRSLCGISSALTTNGSGLGGLLICDGSSSSAT